MMKRWLQSLAAVAVLCTIVAVAGATMVTSRSDCPGKVVCPLTGNEVCRDQCPLEAEAPEESDETPACCRR